MDAAKLTVQLQSLATWAAAQAEAVERYPLLLTRKRHQALVGAIREGKREAAACVAAGVDRFDLDAWVERGELAAGGMYREFWADFTTAQAGNVARKSATVARVAIPLSYTPHDYQRKLHALQLDWAHGDRYRRFIAACCGRRGGKT